MSFQRFVSTVHETQALSGLSRVSRVLSKALCSTLVLSDPDSLTCFPAQTQALLHEWPPALRLPGSSN